MNVRNLLMVVLLVVVAFALFECAEVEAVFPGEIEDCPCCESACVSPRTANPANDAVPIAGTCVEGEGRQCSGRWFLCWEDTSDWLCRSALPATPSQGQWSCEEDEGYLVCLGDTVRDFGALRWAGSREVTGLLCHGGRCSTAKERERPSRTRARALRISQASTTAA